MSEMVERGARAIAQVANSPPIPWDNLSVQFQNICRDYASAVFKSAREPTEAMAGAAGGVEEFAALWDQGETGNADLAVVSHYVLRQLIASWRERGEKIEILEAEIRVMRVLPSAIDAALKDGSLPRRGK
jgi:hypothetical protein